MDDSRVPDGLLLRTAALGRGHSDDELARMVRAKDLVRLQRGAYLEDGTEPDDRLRVLATVAGLRRGGTVSHSSAAVLHGLPLWRIPHRRVHVTRPPASAGSGSARVHLHVGRLPDQHIADVDGIPVTDVARTVLDVARSVSFESAVIVADAALCENKTTPTLLAERLAELGPLPGARRAAAVVRFADRRSESVGESRSRVMMHRLHLPAPDLQVRVRVHGIGNGIVRCDFGWDEYGTVGEFDGRIKYGRLLRPGQDPGDAVFEEKLREDALRDAGKEVARWTWWDLDTPRVVVERLHRAFARGRSRA